MKPIIELKDVKKSYDGAVDVIDELSLEINEGEFVTLLGPSGCGKTTILRMIGGFDTPTSGTIFLDGKDISLLPPNQRPINTVFQKYALFPHLNVYDNIAFGLKIKKLSKEAIDLKVKEALEIVDLEGFEKRNINTLSGGQQQRIAIARAIVNEPRVLLFDEPLSALDYKMRKEMQLELKKMHKRLGITFVFVTHDQEEALTMSDKVVVLAKGKIQQYGTPEDIYNEPANVFVADFIGESNIFMGMMSEDKSALFAGSLFKTVDDYAPDTRIDAVIRPEDVEITDPSSGQLRGIVTDTDFKGTFYVSFVEFGRFEMEVHTFKYYAPGTEVGMYIAPDNIHIIPYDEKKNRYAVRFNSITSDGKVNVTFGDITAEFLPEQIFKNGYIEDGVLYNGDKEQIYLDNDSFTAYIDPKCTDMSDDIGSGLVTGVIEDFFYMGDHYSYTIKSMSGNIYSADDEDLWNIGDRIDIVTGLENIKFKCSDN